MSSFIPRAFQEDWRRYGGIRSREDLENRRVPGLKAGNHFPPSLVGWNLQRVRGWPFNELQKNGFGVRAIPVVSWSHLTPRFPRIPDVDRPDDGPENNQKGDRHHDYLPHGKPSKELNGTSAGIKLTWPRGYIILSLGCPNSQIRKRRAMKSPMTRSVSTKVTLIASSALSLYWARIALAAIAGGRLASTRTE